MNFALDGIRVIDLTQVIMGPSSTAQLADHGAEVIKIERPKFGDLSRQFAPYKDGESLSYQVFNRNKKSIAIDLKNPDGLKILFNLIKVSDVIPLLLDTRDINSVDQIFKEHKPEIIIHMAAQSLVRKSYENPIDTFETNILGTANLLQAVKETKHTQVFVNVTSDKCYANTSNEISGFSEDFPMGGYDPYSSSKGCAELVTSAYRNSFFNPNEFENHKLSLSSVRAGNVIGGGDWGKDRLIPDIINGISKKQSIEIRNPNSIRPWQFVLDALNGYLVLAEKMWKNGKDFSEAWNFGPKENDCKTVQWVLENMSGKWDNLFSWKKNLGNNPHESKILKLNCTKAHKRLGWYTKLTVDETIQWTIDWYSEYFNDSDMKTVSENQIEKFLSR